MVHLHQRALRGAAASLLALCAWAAPASASPIVLGSCLCSLSSDAEVFETLVPPVHAEDPKGPTPFSTGPSFLQSNAATEHELQAQGRAQVDVTLTGSVLAASGGSSLSLDRPANVPDGSSASAGGSVTARWTFDVLVDSLFTLVGLVDTSTITSGSAVNSGAGNVMSLVRLDVLGAALFSALTDDEAFSVSGVMPAGRYRLSAETNVSASTRFAGSASAESSFDFRLELTPLAVPEPSAAWLVVLAAALMGRAGGRSRSSHAQASARPIRIFCTSDVPS